MADITIPNDFEILENSKSANFILSAGDNNRDGRYVYQIDTTAASITASLGSVFTEGDILTFIDKARSFGTNAFTIDPGAGEDISLSFNGVQQNVVGGTDKLVLSIPVQLNLKLTADGWINI